jgi:hypothetical protein
VLRVRDADGLRTLSDRARSGAVEGALQRAGLDGTVAGSASFLWQNRLVRVAAAPTGDFVSLVLRISGADGAEPPEAVRWREGAPRLLVVHGARHADFDRTLRTIANGFDSQGFVRVAVDLPVPELLGAASVKSALNLDPDLLIVGRLEPGDVGRIREAVESGVRVAVAARSLRPFAAADPIVCPI